MKIRNSLLMGLCSLAIVAGLHAGPVRAATLAISCGAVGLELVLCKEASEAWAERTGNEVNVVSTPNSTTERLALYQQILAAGATDIDVLQIDVIWPGILGNHFIDLTPYMAGEIEQHFPAIVANNTVDGRLVAMPWFTDAGMLYYRKDLLEKHGVAVPRTWGELTEAAKLVQDAERAAGQDKMWGFVWQGRAYEGLTCDALEWVISHGGGSVVEPDGNISINNDRAKAALTLAASWVGTITPDGVLNYAEEEARGVFQSGNAVFMRNWPYAWALANGDDSPVKGKVGVAALPQSEDVGRFAATLGGWQLAVSKYSENKDAAADLVKYLASYDEQKRRAIRAAYNPTIAKLYEDQDVLGANPFFGSLYEVFVNAAPRPSTVTGSKYNRVSKEFWSAVHQTLSGSLTAEVALSNLERKLKKVKRRSW
jgi:trehalose/maltose transport system substrate-binding protein